MILDSARRLAVAFFVATAGILPASTISAPALAATVFEKRIAVFDGPEAKAVCAKVARGKWPWGRRWSTCVGWTLHWKRHALYLKVDSATGAELNDAVRKAVQTASTAAAVAFVATPGEFAARSAAALLAAKVAFAGALDREMAKNFSIRVTNQEWWP